MADKPAKTKRRLKDPETFRERAIKASEAGEGNRKLGKARQATRKATAPVARPFAAVFRTLSRFRPFRIIGKILLPPFIRRSWHELRLVEWPSWKQSLRLTFAVIVFAVIFGATVAAVDYGLDKIFRQLLV